MSERRINKINKINKIMILSLIVSVLIVNTIPVLGYDANNPASYMVQYIIPSDTSFVVSPCGAETTIDFNPTTINSKMVEPDCQSRATNKPWANITNSGNLNANYSTNLTTLNPSWIELYIGSNPSMTDQVTVTTSVLSPTGWNSVVPGNVVELYVLANFTGAQGGTTTRTIQINSE